MLGINLGDEVTILHKVNVSREGNIIDEAVQWLPATIQGHDLLGLVHDFLRQGILDRITGNQHTILWVGRPSVKELPGDSRLQHTGRGKDDTRPSIIKAIDVDRLEVANVSKGEGVGNIHLRTDASIHHVGVRLIDAKGPAGQLGGVPDGDALQMRVGLPVLVKNQEQLLRPTEGKYWDEAPSTARYDPLHRSREPCLPFRPRGVNLHSVGGLNHEDVGFDVGNFCRHEMAIVFHAVITGVQEGPATNLQQEHGRSEDVAGVEGAELERPDRYGLVVIDQLDLVAALGQFFLGVQNIRIVVLVVVSTATAAGTFLDRHEAEVISEQQPNHRLGRVRHEDSAAEAGPLGEVGQTGGMVQMEMSDQQHIDAFRLDPIEEGQTIETVVAGMDAAVEQDGHSAEFQKMAGPSDLLARAERRYCHHILEHHRVSGCCLALLGWGRRLGRCQWREWYYY